MSTTPPTNPSSHGTPIHLYSSTTDSDQFSPENENEVTLIHLGRKMRVGPIPRAKFLELFLPVIVQDIYHDAI